MKRYTVEIEVQKQEILVVAKDESDAILKAQDRFYAATRGLPIKKTKVVYATDEIKNG